MKIISAKSAPSGILCFTVHQPLPSPISPKLDWGATRSNEPGAAPGGWVGENSVDSGAGFMLLVGCTCLEWT